MNKQYQEMRQQSVLLYVAHMATQLYYMQKKTISIVYTSSYGDLKMAYLIS